MRSSFTTRAVRTAPGAVRGATRGAYSISRSERGRLGVAGIELAVKHAGLAFPAAAVAAVEGDRDALA